MLMAQNASKGALNTDRKPTAKTDKQLLKKGKAKLKQSVNPSISESIQASLEFQCEIKYRIFVFIFVFYILRWSLIC